jgi:hypothetical protein
MLTVVIGAIFALQLMVIQAEQAGLFCSHSHGAEAASESSSASTDSSPSHECCGFCCHPFLGHPANFSIAVSFGDQESYVLLNDLLPDSPILTIDYPPQLSLS